jgi:CheY-like chemotaxis protein
MALVLVATDDAALGHALSCEIEGLGFDSLWEVDGHSAHLAAVERLPEVILLDANLTVHTGLELSGLLRAEPDLPRETRIVLLSDDAVDPHTLEHAGVNTVFPKAHDGAALRELLVAAAQAVPGR